MTVEQLGEAFEVIGFDGLVGEHEWCLRQRLDVSKELAPGGKAVPVGELAARLGDADGACSRDAFGASLVVVDVVAERLLETHGRGRF
jgi:hypothetical protein